MDKRKIIYYENELTDEFSRAQITPRAIDGSYVYLHDSRWKRFTHFFWYRVVAHPLAWIYTKAAFRHRIVHRSCLTPYRGSGFFLYGNHTQEIADALIPSLITLPTETYVIVHPNNVSMPVLGRITPSLGALPLPDDRDAYKNFIHAIEARLQEGKAITIYPEAHIWPFYTGIRPFPSDSFTYPVKYGTPVFCFTNTYQKRKHSKKPRIVTYVDGPFFPDPSLSPRRQREDLRNQVHTTMTQRAKSSTVQWIHYEKKENPYG